MKTKTLRVLIADDEDDTRDLLGMSLGRADMHVDTVASGVEAIALLPRGYDILVTDIVMPGMDGLELLQWISARELELIRIVITSFADKNNVKEALNHGADYLLEKPFAGAQLIKVIRHLTTPSASRRPTGSGSYRSPTPLPDDDDISELFQRRLASLPLTVNEQRIVTYILKGLANKDIADILQNSEQTIKNRINTIYKKLQISSRSQLFHIVFPI